MQKEIEVKFLNIDHKLFREILLGVGAKCIMPNRLMRRAILDYPDKRLQNNKNNSYIRVRDEGNKITLTFKQFKSLSVDGAREIETEVKSFNETVQILTSIGLRVESLQESKRETWVFDGCEIVLDEWPWLKPYIEIEGDSEDSLRIVSKKLGLDWENAEFGDVMVAYRKQYPHLKMNDTVGNISEVKFNTPLPTLFKKIDS